MANNCYNHITLQGSADVLTKVVERLETYDQFNYLNGWGDYVLGIRDDFDYKWEEDERKDGYYYGSRWFLFDIELESDTLTISGDSAWSPLIKLTEEICKVYNLKGEIYYSESGSDIAGKLSFDGDKECNRIETTCKHMNYLEDVQYWLEDMIGHLDGADEEEVNSVLTEAATYASKENLNKLTQLIGYENNDSNY